MDLMRSLRSSIIEARFPEFVRDFMNKQFPDRKYPTWVSEAMATAGIELD